ncbi:unnamed protein product [Closterium sp. Yama58-4]|nr:unnamed protein product [Closterium sp. Yama58-4]
MAEFARCGLEDSFKPSYCSVRGVDCDGRGMINALDLSSRSLAGCSIPYSISKLTAMTKLYDSLSPSPLVPLTITPCPSHHHPLSLSPSPLVPLTITPCPSHHHPLSLSPSPLVPLTITPFPSHLLPLHIATSAFGVACISLPSKFLLRVTCPRGSKE